MVLILPLIYNSSSPFSKAFHTVPSAQIQLGLLSFSSSIVFCSLVRSKYLFIFSFSLIFTSSTRLQILFFVLIITKSSLLAHKGKSVCISNFQWFFFFFLRFFLTVCEFFSPVTIGGFHCNPNYSIIDTSIFDIFLRSPARSRYFSSFLLPFNFEIS